jgi:phage terminase large subunit-like protein
MLNATQDTNLNMYVNKKRSNGKVDMTVALINAVYLMAQDIIFNPESDWGAMVI